MSKRESVEMPEQRINEYRGVLRKVIVSNTLDCRETARGKSSYTEILKCMRWMETRKRKEQSQVHRAV